MRPKNDPQANKDLVRQMIEEVWNANRPDRLPEFWAEATRAEAERLHTILTGAFPDLRIAVDDTVAESDKVVTRLTFRGTHRGPFRGIEPTGRPVTFESIRIYQVNDGQVTDTWAVVDALGLLAQLKS